MPDDIIEDKDLDDALFGNTDDIGDADNAEDDDGDNDADEDNDADGDTGGDDGDKDGNIDWKNELNKARSDWGRKQKTLETQIETLTNNVNKMVESFSTNQQRNDNQQVDDSEMFDNDKPIPLTMGGLSEAMNNIMNNKQTQNTNLDKAYENGYMKEIGNLGGNYSDKVHQHIVDRMFKEFNVRHSENSKIDAELNFARAEAAVLRDVRTRTNPLKGNSAGNPLGGSTNTNQDINSSTPVKLDSYAQEFIKATGMKTEDAQKALRGDMPLYLRGKVAV